MAHCKNWCYTVKKKFEDLRLNGFTDNQGRLSEKMYVNAVQEVLARSEESAWLDIIDKGQATTGRGHNNLRTCRLMKCTYETEQYCLSCLPIKHRSL